MSKKLRWTLSLIIVLFLAVALIWWLAPGVIGLTRELVSLLLARDYEGFTALIHSFGATGLVVLFAVQAVQTFLPFFPEALLQIVAGATYGLWVGTAVLMVSYALCNFVIFYLLRRYHFELPEAILRLRPVQKCHRLLTRADPELVVFSLYLFPFLSNCFVPYFSAQTTISTRRYCWIMILSCLPMMLTSVYLGERLLARDWLMAGVAFVVGAGISLVLYFGQNRFLAWLERRHTP